MTRAVRLASEWALGEGGIARLQLWAEPENLASQAVAARSGYRREGVLRKYDEIGGRRVDSVMFSLLPEDLTARASALGGLTLAPPVEPLDALGDDGEPHREPDVLQPRRRADDMPESVPAATMRAARTRGGRRRSTSRVGHQLRVKWRNSLFGS